MSAEKLKSKEAEVGDNDIIDEPPKTYSEHIKELKEAQGTLPTSDIEDTSQNDEEKQKQIDEMRLKVLEQAKKPDDTPEDERANIELVKFGVVDIPRELLGEDKVLVDEIKHRSKLDILGRKKDSANLQRILDGNYDGDEELKDLFSPTVAGLLIEKIKKDPDVAIYDDSKLFEALPLETQLELAQTKGVASTLIYGVSSRSFHNKLASGIITSLETPHDSPEKITEQDLRTMIDSDWSLSTQRRNAHYITKDISRRLFKDSMQAGAGKLNSALVFLDDEDLFGNLKNLAEDGQTVFQVHRVNSAIEYAAWNGEPEKNISEWQENFRESFAPEFLRLGTTDLAFKYKDLTPEEAKAVVSELDSTKDIREKMELDELNWDELRTTKPDIYSQIVTSGGVESDVAKNINMIMDTRLARMKIWDSIKTIDDLKDVDAIFLSAAKESLNDNPDAARELLSQSVFGLGLNELAKDLVALGVADVSVRASFERSAPGEGRLKLKNLENLGNLSQDEKLLVEYAVSLIGCGKGALRSQIDSLEKHHMLPDEKRKLVEILDEAMAKKRQELSNSYSQYMRESLAKSARSVGETEYDGQSIPILNMEGNDFMLLIHRLGAYSYKNKDDPSQWNSDDGLSEYEKGVGYISTTAIAHGAIHLAAIKSDEIGNSDEVFYSFSKLGNQSIFSTYESDTHTHIKNKRHGRDVVTSIDTFTYTFFYDKPDELIKKTRKRSYDEFGYNEVALDRYSGSPDQHGGRLQPSEIIVFTDDPSKIGDLPKKHAAYFGIPIIMIDPKKHK